MSSNPSQHYATWAGRGNPWSPEEKQRLWVLRAENPMMTWKDMEVLFNNGSRLLRTADALKCMWHRMGRRFSYSSNNPTISLADLTRRLQPATSALR
jgi:hypothetical protein